MSFPFISVNSNVTPSSGSPVSASNFVSVNTGSLSIVIFTTGLSISVVSICTFSTSSLISPSIKSKLKLFPSFATLNLTGVSLRTYPTPGYTSVRVYSPVISFPST